MGGMGVSPIFCFCTCKMKQEDMGGTPMPQ